MKMRTVSDLRAVRGIVAARDEAEDPSYERTASDHEKAPGLLDVERHEISLASGE